MSVTLKDVASASGVSAATASRVLSGDPRISEPTRLRVREAVRTLGYRRAGSGARTMNVGFVISEMSKALHEDLFFGELMAGVTERLEPRGYHALLSSTVKRSRNAELPRVVGRVDGVIAGGADLDASTVEALARGPVPVVFVGRYGAGGRLNAVLPGNEEGASLVAEHLLEIGRRTFAFIGAALGSNVFKDRLAGFRHTLAEAGLTLDARLVLETRRTPQDVFARTLELFEEAASFGNVPDAIFAAEDWVAMGVLRALRLRGLRVPEDVAVVGYNDVPQAPVSDPPLTTVHVPKRRLGNLAAKLLLDIIEGEIEGPVRMAVSPHLVVRESSVRGASGAPPD